MVVFNKTGPRVNFPSLWSSPRSNYSILCNIIDNSYCRHLPKLHLVLLSFDLDPVPYLFWTNKYILCHNSYITFSRGSYIGWAMCAECVPSLSFPPLPSPLPWLWYTTLRTLHCGPSCHQSQYFNSFISFLPLGCRTLTGTVFEFRTPCPRK